MSVTKYKKYTLNYMDYGFVYIFYFDILDLAEEKDGDGTGI